MRVFSFSFEGQWAMETKVASVEELRAIEAAADRSWISYDQMMVNAGRSASAYLQSRVELNAASVVVILAGKGNNGGDGLVMALDLAQKTGADVRLYLLEKRDSGDRHFQAAVDSGIVFGFASADSEGAMLANWMVQADVIVDALFGIGLRLPLRGLAADLLQSLAKCLAEKATDDNPLNLNSLTGSASQDRRRPFVLAIDCPSGVDCDSGEVDPKTITADATITFIAAKPGLLTFPAAGKVGELVVASIGLPPTLPELQAISTVLVDGKLAASLLPPRPLDGHKGTFGKVMLIAGSPNYIGAVALAGESAGRSGVGLVTIGTSQALINIVSSGLREPTWLALRTDGGAISDQASETVAEAAQAYDALLVGCGLGLHDSTQAFVKQTARADELPPLVLDADALNALSRQPDWWKSLPAGTIITPHSGEMSRLTGLSTAQINGDRWQVSRHYSAKWNVVVVLKGAHTIIADPNGETSVIPFKTDALGTAGTGDILAGLIVGLRAQNLSAYDSARLGAYVHALAGTIAAGEVCSSRSVMAGDVLAWLGAAFAQIEGF